MESDQGLGRWHAQFDLVTIGLAPIRKVGLEIQKSGVSLKVDVSPDEARHLARILNATADKADSPLA